MIVTPRRVVNIMEVPSLKTIEADELRCEVRELKHFPLLLYVYRTSYTLPDGSYRKTFDRKSALVLVDTKTLRIIDFAFESGYRTDSSSSVEPHHEGSWDHEDGTSIRYIVRPTGFEISKG